MSSSKNNPFTTNFNHRLNVELNASPLRLHDCMNPVLARAAALADLMEVAVEQNNPDYVDNLWRAVQAIHFEILDAQAILNAYVDGASVKPEASPADIAGGGQ